ncbi:family 78 glycoside hydrolase catalytic domain [Leucobacter sp. NPDC058333]|uniref:family 78 glycoside hydrolase catalytic domain n=1 Tax=Leucobacter sp. NPDC058333 TaxID=3346450 RepID=UPI003658C3B8
MTTPSTTVRGPVRAEQLAPNLPGSASEATLVGVTRPRLSWRYESNDPAWRQQRRELQLTRDGATETHTTSDSEQVLVEWPFKPLRSRERVTLRVRGGDDVSWTPWSEPAEIEAGLFEADDWSARWVTPAETFTVADPAPIVGIDFAVRRGVRSARLYFSVLGIAVARINGTLVSEDHFAPGWTSYEHRIRYQSYDVTALISEGPNTLRALLGNGWFRGRIASFALHRGRAYGERLAFLAQLELHYDDGSIDRVVTDDAWSTGTSRVLLNDFYDGQHIDLRRDPHPALDGTVTILPTPTARLVTPEAPPVRAVDTLPAVSVRSVSHGRHVVDFGQNVVGWVRIRARGRRGQEVVVRHAEVLEGGELSMRPLRSAQATDRYVLAGVQPRKGFETLEPELVFHGFRYADVTGLDELTPGDVEAIVVGSRLERTGWFATSDAALSQLHENIVWGMRGNFLDLPTDCPQRDERLGWTGDAQVFAPAAATLFDVAGFFSSWLGDLAADQLPDGTVPAVVPRVFSEETPFAGWGDAAVIVPWVIFERYGDAGILRRQYDSMRRWVDRVADLAGPTHLWSQGEQLGDWLDPLAPPDSPAEALADPAVVATAYFARSAHLLARAATVLGERDDAHKYRVLAENVRRAFCAEYVSSEGVVRSDCQTVYALALHWRIIDDAPTRASAGARLATLVARQNYTVATGFLGTPVILDALSGTGFHDAAYRMLLSHERPSWLYAVDMGATTVWERWDSMLPDGSVNPGEMTSFNHYAFGAIADWMHREVAGLQPIDAGYRRVRIAPTIGGGLTSASARHLSPYGEVAVEWAIEGPRFTLSTVIPVGVTAKVVLPGGVELFGLGHGKHRFEVELPAEAGD